MFYAKTLPFIYSDLFILIAIIGMSLLAIIALVIIPIFFLRKTPNHKANFKINKDGEVILNDELGKYFSSIKKQYNSLHFTRLEGIEKVMVVVIYRHFLSYKPMAYQLDFSSSEDLKVYLPRHYKEIYSLTITEADYKEDEIISLKKKGAFIYSIGVGVALAADIYLIVLIYSTHLRTVQYGYVGFYFLAALGAAIVPGIYFLIKLVLKLTKGGK